MSPSKNQQRKTIGGGGVTVGIAIAASAAFHATLWFALPDVFATGGTPRLNTPKLELPVTVAEEEIPPELLPAEFLPVKPKFVEINPEAPNLLPPDTRNVGAATQRAAQPDPDTAAPARQPAPKVDDGDNPDSIRIQKNLPRELRPAFEQPIPGIPLGLPSEDTNREYTTAPAPAAPADTSGAGAAAAASDSSAPNASPTPETKPVSPAAAERPIGPNPSDERRDPPPPKTPPADNAANNSPGNPAGGKPANANQAPALPAAAVSKSQSAPPLGDVPLPPSPLPRPQAAKVGTTGDILKVKISSCEAGTIALDARFTEYGDYTQRFLEIIQASWWTNLGRLRLNVPESMVVIEFTLCKDGTLKDVVITHHNSTEPAAYACKDAIESRSPFDPWPAKMIEDLGNEDRTTIVFSYKRH